MSPGGLENIRHEIEVKVDDSKNKNNYCDAEHLKELKSIVKNTTFGFMILQGPNNLNSLTFFNAEKQITDSTIRKKTPKRKALSSE
jgi:hypothetical protein